MGEYNDFEMMTPQDGTTVADVCLARGINDSVPPQWLIHLPLPKSMKAPDPSRRLEAECWSAPAPCVREVLRHSGSCGRGCRIVRRLNIGAERPPLDGLRRAAAPRLDCATGAAEGKAGAG